MTASPFMLPRTTASPTPCLEHGPPPIPLDGPDFAFLLDEMAPSPRHSAPCDEAEAPPDDESDPPPQHPLPDCTASPMPSMVQAIDPCWPPAAPPPDQLNPVRIPAAEPAGSEQVVARKTRAHAPSADKGGLGSAPKVFRQSCSSGVLAMQMDGESGVGPRPSTATPEMAAIAKWESAPLREGALREGPLREGLYHEGSLFREPLILSSRETRPSLLQNVGTGDAKQPSHMSTALKQNEIAPPTEQILPDLKGAMDVTLKPAPDTREDVRLVHFSPGEHFNMRVDITSQRTVTTNAAPPNRASEAQLLAQLSRAISSEVRVMRQMKPDRLAVVFRPNGGTKIFLQLAMRQGNIEAFARCDRGDFNFFNAHWPELQQSMQQQGVRLLDLKEPVTHTFDPGDGRFPGHNRRQTPEEPDSCTSSTARESRPERIEAGPARNGLGRNRGLELWA